jgi:hypothetical protein
LPRLQQLAAGLALRWEARFRSVETQVQAAAEKFRAYLQTGEARSDFD